MRYVCLAAISFIGLPLLCGQAAAQTLKMTNYQEVDQQRVSGSLYSTTFSVDILNSGTALSSVKATVTSLDPNSFTVTQGTVNYGAVPANGRATTRDTFTILQDHAVAFSFSSLQWSFQVTAPAPPPVANAGPNQTVPLHSTVTLNGSGSTNPSGIGTLSYSWGVTTRPAGSTAVLTSPTSVMPTFTADVAGNYVLTLTVSNGTAGSSASVTVSTLNSPPVANAGPNQTVAVGATVTLTGAGSTDVDGNPLTYAWTLTSRPVGSSAVLTGATSISPAFVADKFGSYTAQLTVNDGFVNGPPSTVTITTLNTAPVANAGPNQSAAVGTLVQLNGANSTDVDGDPLTYSWSLIAKPAGSTAKLNSATIVNPSFTPELAGAYVAQLIVNDGLQNSAPATVTITTNAVQAPTANAGTSQNITAPGTTVSLSGSGIDPQALSLTFHWSLTSKPPASAANLSNANTATPSFVVDVPGAYVAQLIVNNGVLNSAPATTTITAAFPPPVANPGPNQNVLVGLQVNLSGIASSDAGNKPLTYAWTLLSRPVGSSAALASAGSVTPSFVADTAGIYVAQLIVNDGFASSNPATVTITAGGNSILLTPNPLILANAGANLTVVLGTPAPGSGQLVLLSSSDPNIATIQAAVLVPSGQSGANVPVNPGTNAGSATLTAQSAGFTNGTGTVTLVFPNFTITLDSGVAGLTKTVNGTVTLNSPAPSFGVSIQLSSHPGGIVDVQPSVVTIAPGTTTASFTVTGLAEGSANVAGSAPGFVTATAPVTVSKSGAIKLPANVSVGPGQSVDFPVILLTGAPFGGVTITLNSANPLKVSIPASVFIPQGLTAPLVQPKVTGVSFGTALIVATAPGLTGDAQQVTVTAGALFSPLAVTIGGTGTKDVNLTLSAPAPAGGAVLNLTSDNPSVATVPTSVAFAPGMTSAIVTVTSVGPGSTLIHASSLPGIPDTALGVTVVVFGNINVPPTLSLTAGQSAPFAISLPAAAPAGGVIVGLTSSDNTVLTVSPALVFIPAGATSPGTQPMATGVKAGLATLTAAASGYKSGVSQLQVTATINFSPNTLTLSGNTTQNITLNLSSPASAGGITVNLSSSNTSVATVPLTATFLAGSTSVNVPVTGVAGGSAVIHASNLPVIADTSATITVNQTPAISVPANMALGLGQSAAYPVSLTLPAPAGGITIALVSSDPSKASLSVSSVTIAPGATAPVTQPQITALSPGSLNISASAPTFATISTAVQVTVSASFSPSSLTIIAASGQSLALTLSGPAPAGGLTINLTSSNPAAASVPATASFLPGSTSVSVPVTGIAVGTAVIHASAPPIIADTTATITVSPAPAINGPGSVGVTLGKSIALPLNLSVPAPANGLTVTLSSNSSNATLPASVFIPAGATTPAVQPQVMGAFPGSAAISISAPGYATANAQVTVSAAINFSPAVLTIAGTATQSIMLNLSGPASAPLTVNLSSSNPTAATVPPSVTFPVGAISIGVPVTGVGGGSAVIHASAQNVPDTTASVTVVSGIMLPANVVVAPGQTLPFSLTLATPAPTSLIVSLTSSDPSALIVNPTNIFIPQGATTPNTPPKITGVNFGSATVTASAFGYASVSSPVQVAAVLALSPANLTIIGGHSQNFILALSSSAPPGGLTVFLSSDTPGVASVRSSVTIPEGSSAIGLSVTGVSAGSATITAAGSPGVVGATATVTVTAPISIILPSFLSVGQTVAGDVLIAHMPVTLSAPAPPGGVLVTLANGDPTIITINTTSVFIPEGLMAPATQPDISGQILGFSTVTASAPGLVPASVIVSVGDEARIGIPTNVTVAVGQTVDLPIGLPGLAPHGGITVFLTSSDSSVTVTPSVFIPEGTSVPPIEPRITGVSVGATATVTAIANGFTSGVAPVTVTAAPASGQIMKTIRLAPRNGRRQ